MSVRARVFDIDMFDNGSRVVRALHRSGRHVICYIDAGTWEKWRPDAGRFPRLVLGKSNGWPGERWLDIRRLGVLKPIMRRRISRCAKRGYDGVEFDNVDGYTNATGFPLTAREQLTYDEWLANAAHRHGLSAALKNDLGQVHALLPYFDYALDEQCFQYRECTRLAPFVNAGKAVFEVEYKLRRSAFCAKADQLGFNSMRKRVSLKAWRRACRYKALFRSAEFRPHDRLVTVAGAVRSKSKGAAHQHTNRSYPGPGEAEEIPEARVDKTPRVRA
jgi:hypothetical protein